MVTGRDAVPEGHAWSVDTSHPRDEPSSPRWDEYTQLRDYLRRHPEIAGAYANLKKALALVFDDDIAGYRNAKRPFLQAVIAKAQVERG
jgi:GrpB-like predicted nucleotidyltransferase (UPF0157 family)